MKKKVKIVGVGINTFSKAEAKRSFVKLLEEGEKKVVVTPNVDFLVNAVEDNDFKRILNSADLSLPDGMPLIWISKFLKVPIKEKISGSSLFFELLERNFFFNKRIFLLGGSNSIILNKAIEKLRSYNLSNVSGYSPPFGFEKNKKNIDLIVEKINSFQPDVLIIGLGSPKQEKLLVQISDNINYRVSMCLGATIDFLGGAKKMPPEFIKNLGFGWLWRLIEEPGRLWRRYLLKDMKFFYYVFQQRFNLRNFD